MQFLITALLAGIIYCADPIKFQTSDINEPQQIADIMVEYLVDGKQKNVDDSCINVRKSDESPYDTIIGGCRCETSFAPLSLIVVKFFTKADDDTMVPANNALYTVIYSKELEIVQPADEVASNTLVFRVTKATKRFCIKLKQSVYLGVETTGTGANTTLEITAPSLENQSPVEYKLNDLEPPATVKIATNEGGVEAYRRFLWSRAKSALECCFDHARLRCTSEFRKQLQKLQLYLKCGKERRGWAHKVSGCFMSTCTTSRKPDPVCSPMPCYPPAPQPCYLPPSRPCYYTPAPQPCYPPAPSSYECSMQTLVLIQFLVKLGDNLGRVIDICRQEPSFLAAINVGPCPTTHQEYICRVDNMIQSTYNDTPCRNVMPQAPIGIVCKSGAYTVDYLTDANKGFIFVCQPLRPLHPKKVMERMKSVRKITKDRKRRRIEDDESSDEEEEDHKKKKSISRGVIIGISCCGGVCLVAVLCYVGYTLM